jgi:hypothetical protein
VQRAYELGMNALNLTRESFTHSVWIGFFLGNVDGGLKPFDLLQIEPTRGTGHGLSV